MKKLIISFMLASVLVLCAYGCLAGGTNTTAAVIDGKSADRVHLRETASTKANSLGLYFTGTEVIYDSSSSGEWTWVTIGSESGYIKSEYLYLGNDQSSIKSQQPSGVVTSLKENSWVNLRANPSQKATAVGKLYKDDIVTVLGETVTKWYYVNAFGTYGYVIADFLHVSETNGKTGNNYGTSQSVSFATPGVQAPVTPAWTSALNAYQSVLQNKTQFFSSDDNKFIFISQLGDSLIDGQLMPSTFSVVDLDGDGIPEVILSESVDGNDYYGFEVLRYQDNVVYGYHFVYRAFMNLKYDGTFSYSSGATDSGYGRVAFTDKAYSINPISYVQGNTYIVNQKNATEKQFLFAISQQNEKADISWYNFTSDNVEAIPYIFN